MAKENKIWQWGLYLLVAAGLLAGLVVAAERAKLEADTKTTLLSLEWNQLKDSAARNGYSVAEALEYFANYEDKALFSGVVYKEPMLLDWQNGGYLQLDSGAQLVNDVRTGAWSIATLDEAEDMDEVELDYNHNYVLCHDEALRERVFANLEAKTSAQNRRYNFSNGEDRLYVVETTYPYTDLSAFGIGFGEEDLALIQNYGLELVVQVRTWQKADPESIEFVFGGLGALGVQAVGFNDNELPGVQQNDWNDITKEMSAVLHRQDLPAMSIEFFAQSGLQSFLRAMDYDMARMHPVSEAELAKIGDARLQERFALAASERGMDVMLLRLRLGQSLEEMAKYIGAVRDAIQAKGLTTDHATVVPDMQAKAWALWAALAAVWAGGVLLLQKFDLKKSAWLLPSLCVVGAAALLVIGKGYLVQKLAALAAVIIFPFLGVSSVVAEEGRSLPRAIIGICQMTLTSLIGAVLVVGILSERSYMSAVNVFSGVKLGQLVPLLLLMVYLLYRLASEHGGATYLLVSLWRLMQKQVTIGLVVLGGMACLLLLYYMLRTGNASVGVSDAERAFRAFLDNVLMVRPRTKEFMFAHPIMLAILYFGYRRQLWPCVLLGAIGQVSLVNTFEHLHTPLTVSLLRTFNGLWLGIVIGVVLILFVKYVGGWCARRVREVASLAEQEEAKLGS